MSRKLLYDTLVKRFALESAKKKGSNVVDIGPEIQELVNKEYIKYIKAFEKAGVDIDKLSPSDVKFTIELNEANKLRKKEGIEKALITTDNTDNIVDMKGKKLDPNEPIIGGTQSDEVLQKSIKKNVEEATKKGDFQGIFNQVLRDPDIAKAFKEAKEAEALADARALQKRPIPLDTIQYQGPDIQKMTGPEKQKYLITNDEQTAELLKRGYTFDDIIYAQDNYGLTAKEIMEEAKGATKKDPFPFQSGGRVGLKDGFPSKEENLRLLKEELKEIFRKQTDPFPKPGGKEFKNFKLGLENIFSKSRPKNADGGRIGLKAGMSRRAFLKLMGGVGAGIGALKTGLLKLAGKESAPQVAKEVVEQTTKSTPPPYFFELAETIKKFGKPDKVTYQDRVEVHRMISKDGKSELELTEDLSTGSMQIKKIKPEEDMINEDIVLEFRKGGVDVDPKTGKAIKEPDEYTEGKEVTQRIYKDDYNQPDFYEGEGVDEIIKEVREAPPIKKAGGGIAGMVNKRFDFDSGGSPLQRLRQSIVNDLLKNVPGIPEADLQILVKDINLDMSPEEAQASIKANFLQLYGKAQGGLAGMLGE